MQQKSFVKAGTIISLIPLSKGKVEEIHMKIRDRLESKLYFYSQITQSITKENSQTLTLAVKESPLTRLVWATGQKVYSKETWMGRESQKPAAITEGPLP